MKTLKFFAIVLSAHIGSIYAQTSETIVFLNDYEVTQDLSDVVHLGDQIVPSFKNSSPEGTTYTVNFNLPYTPAPGTEFVIHLDHYAADPYTGPYADQYSYVSVNGIQLGFLEDSSSNHWYSQQFRGSADLLTMLNNNLSIDAFYDPGVDNYDDFEFTNLYVSYYSNAEANTKPQISVVGGFIKLDTTSGNAPDESDCLESSHYGRLVFDEVGNKIYVCSSTGWVMY